MNKIKIRSAVVDDIPLIFSFIQKKSEFDCHIGAYSGVLQVTEEKIRKTIFGEIPFSFVLFAENSDRAIALRAEPKAIGFALYAFRYSSFLGQPSLWLDDLYVDEDMRSQGAGKALMNYLAQIAKNNDCSHLAWNADARNTRGLNFYYKLGAKITEQKGDRLTLEIRDL
jgi:GNAT superfamily N-acetyltransferase